MKSDAETQGANAIASKDLLGEWRWLNDGEVMREGDTYASGKKVGWHGPGYHSINKDFRNGIDEDVIRTKETDLKYGIIGKLYFVSPNEKLSV